MADAITVLRDGETVGTVDTSTTSKRELAELMVGREVLLDVEKPPSSPGDVGLEVSDLTVTDDRGVDQVSSLDFQIREGEVFGIAGVDGNGQSELVEAITGLDVPDEGRVYFDGADVTTDSRRDRIEQGMAYIPEDRQHRGLVMDFELLQNGLLGSQHDPDFAPGGRIDWATLRQHVEDIIADYDVRPPNPDATAKSLSGGNQQKLVAGREFERDPRVVVASHPTRGLDVGSVEFVQEKLVELRNEGKPCCSSPRSSTRSNSSRTDWASCTRERSPTSWTPTT
ncbi:ATP-binding cassette domain-containing protein [Haloarculaceae archaeon H-GB2-1]|nr:ATP-binding cassette domain-containing protein [Haloarculaceae archaeon H-GB2-1]